MRRLAAATRFLTPLPIPGQLGTAPEDLASSVVAFPVLGLLAGLMLGGLAAALSLVFPPLVTAVMLVLAMAGVSGAMHLDGLADTADGFLSSRPRGQILEIMRDSRVGVMGVLAIMAGLLMKVSCLASLPTDRLWRAVVLMPLAGRCAMVLMMALLPYVRETGLGSVLAARSHRPEAVWSVGLLGSAGWLLAGVGGLVAGGLAVAAVAALCWQCRRKIGGATGDTYGAACEFGEVAAALAMTVRFTTGAEGALL